MLETARQVESVSVSTNKSDVPFKEMADHCDALLMGKQQKLSVFAASQQKQDNTILSLSSYPNQLQTVCSLGLCLESFFLLCIFFKCFDLFFFYF